MSRYRIVADGRDKGEVHHDARRWCWYRPNGGKESYPRRFKKADVMDHVRRTCNAAEVHLIVMRHLP